MPWAGSSGVSGEPWISSSRTGPAVENVNAMSIEICPRPGSQTSIGQSRIAHHVTPHAAPISSIAAARSWTRNPTWNNCPSICDMRRT